MGHRRGRRHRHVRGHTLKRTGIAFWDRTTGAESAKFRDLCSQGIGTLREHKATAPPDVDEE